MWGGLTPPWWVPSSQRCTERGDAVHGGEQLVRLLARRPDRLGLVLVSLARGAVARKPIGDHRRAGLDASEHELPHRRAGNVGNHLQSAASQSAALALDRDFDHHLSQRAAPTDPWLWPAEERLVDLDRSAQPLPTRTHHRSAVPMQHRPRRLLRADPERPLQPER